MLAADPKPDQPCRNALEETETIKETQCKRHFGKYSLAYYERRKHSVMDGFLDSLNDARREQSALLDLFQ
jgi:hypothetical protein